MEAVRCVAISLDLSVNNVSLYISQFLQVVNYGFWQVCILAFLFTFLMASNSLFAVDIISAIEFDKSGDHLATGDRGGRVVLFERTDVRDVCLTAYFLILLLWLCFSFTFSQYAVM